MAEQQNDRQHRDPERLSGDTQRQQEERQEPPEERPNRFNREYNEIRRQLPLPVEHGPVLQHRRVTELRAAALANPVSLPARTRGLSDTRASTLQRAEQPSSLRSHASPQGPSQNYQWQNSCNGMPNNVSRPGNTRPVETPDPRRPHHSERRSLSTLGQPATSYVPAHPPENASTSTNTSQANGVPVTNHVETSSPIDDGGEFDSSTEL